MVPSGALSALMSQAPKGGTGRAIGGMMGGFGQAMMDQNMRRTYGTARSGGFNDLMENRQIGDFVTGDLDPKITGKFQDLSARIKAGRYMTSAGLK